MFKLKAGFSIIVCAYNAEKRLSSTLISLSSLIIPEHLPVELILVDNNSSDKTSEFAFNKWNQLGNIYPISIIHEVTPGLVNARRCGVLAAKYRYGIFCDDDNWLDSRYLVEASHIFDMNPYIGIIGGCSVPVSDVELPSWFYTKSASFAVGIQHDSDGYVSWRKYVWGAGMCFLVQPFQSIYKSNVPHLTLGRCGTALTSGDDGEICAWFLILGYKLFYSSRLQLKHYMSSHRLTDEYYLNFFEKKISSFWSVYSDFLTAFYLLPGRKIDCLRDFAGVLLYYPVSVIRLVLSPLNTFKIFQLVFKLKKIQRI